MAMMVKTELEILDVRHFSARQMRPLLEQEARLWQQRLRWDYRGATDLLLQYLDSRILPGFVALDRGRLCGYTFCVYEGRKAVVGDAFALDNSAMPALETTHGLLRHLLQVLTHAPDIDRIESQLLLYDATRIAGPFAEAAFQTHRRLFMQVDLAPLRPAQAHGGFGWLGLPLAPRPVPSPPGTLDLQRWIPSDYNPAAELIHAAYQGHIDAHINDQYRTLEGSLRFLHNIVRFPGCGTFDPRSSWTLRDRLNGSLAGVLLCSRVQADTAHVTQLCVAPARRGQGLGGYLLRHVLHDLAAAGLAAVTLTVTEANDQAVRLYRQARFATVHVFDAHVLDTARDRFRLPAAARAAATPFSLPLG